MLRSILLFVYFSFFKSHSLVDEAHISNMDLIPKVSDVPQPVIHSRLSSLRRDPPEKAPQMPRLPALLLLFPLAPLLPFNNRAAHFTRA